jgi:hypothetical protein
MKSPTKADLARSLEQLRAENAVLRAQLAAQRAANPVRSTKRPPFFTAFEKRDAFNLRERLAAANHLNHAWCVEPRTSPRGTVYLVY